MPSAIETLVKILKLERQQGCKNNAVIGGIGAYAKNWVNDAHKQARNGEQRALVDELHALLFRYEALDVKTERFDLITYMLDRITGRTPMPPEYQARAAEYTRQQTVASPPTVEPEATPVAPRDQPEREREPVRPRAAKPKEREEKRRKDKEREKPVTPAPEKARIEAHDADNDNEPEITETVFETSDGIEATYTGQLDIPLDTPLARPPRRPKRHLETSEAADLMRGLKASVMNVKGVGPTKGQHLRKLGIETLDQLMYARPRRYDDYRRLMPIAKLLPEMRITVIGTVRKAEIHIGRNNRKDFFMEVDDGTGMLSVLFYGQHFLVRSIRVGNQLVINGETSIFNGRIRLVNPEWEKLDVENLHNVGIIPIYPLTEGLTARTMRRLMRDAVEYWAERLPDFIPDATLERAELADLGWALKHLHFPEGWDHLHHAQQRLGFDELILLQLAILGNRREWQSKPGIALEIGDQFMDEFIEAVFPYPLTGAQRRAIEDIRRDVSQAIPMNRLLQGDVGSGKTAVALTSLIMAFANGKQAALMAPTGILAEQHYRNLTRMLERMPGEHKPTVKLLTGSLSNSERDAVYNGLAEGWIDIVIGTHALIQEGVQFNELAIVVIDEQHRFGVEQRGALRGKGTNPHVLVMTATPIPRTLALTMYADLDLSVMDEMPPGRIPVRTRIVYPVHREKIYEFIEAQLKEGRQAFVVHPLVEASDKIEAESAVEAYERLQKVFHRYKVGLLHGKMKPAEKDDIMARFSGAEFDVLVTTSVAEVGVDVPNASVIVIEGANRFGLAQLHQFRGRVGRGGYASFCLLIPDNTNRDAMERLQALEATNDGFKLAEIDWKLRGMGDLIGTRQSGSAELRFADVITPELVQLAQREARTIYAEDPYLERPEHRLLRQRVTMLYRPESDLS
ncbi:MAG: ATP-dependent DNA helicase RecG [Anaerolineae bacterium]|jgi:ATP-dependent DNA helicase RecG|nr:ATP-dependent DNA helicase RecG [Anaerolineae bacterium]